MVEHRFGDLTFADTFADLRVGQHPSVARWAGTGRTPPGGVEDPVVVEPEVGVHGQHPDHMRLHDRHGDHFGVGQLRRETGGWAWFDQFGAALQVVVDLDIQCDGKGLQIGVHVAFMVIVASATSIMEALARLRSPTQESLV
jgi:hypothetical protein